MQTARPWLDQCAISARDLKHPTYSTTQLRATPGVAVQRIRNSYNPSLPPKFRKVIRRIGPDGKVQYDFIHDEAGLYNMDGSYAKSAGLFATAAKNQQHFSKGQTSDSNLGGKRPHNIPTLNYDTSALDYAAQDGVASNAQYQPHVVTNNSERMLLCAPDSPVMESQRSTERVRALQAILGDHIAHTHGKPPPRAAPFFQSGAICEATNDEADVMTPVALPVA